MKKDIFKKIGILLLFSVMFIAYAILAFFIAAVVLSVLLIIVNSIVYLPVSIIIGFEFADMIGKIINNYILWEYRFTYLVTLLLLIVVKRNFWIPDLKLAVKKWENQIIKWWNKGLNK